MIKYYILYALCHIYQFFKKNHHKFTQFGLKRLFLNPAKRVITANLKTI